MFGERDVWRIDQLAWKLAAALGLEPALRCWRMEQQGGDGCLLPATTSWRCPAVWRRLSLFGGAAAAAAASGSAAHRQHLAFPRELLSGATCGSNLKLCPRPLPGAADQPASQPLSNSEPLSACRPAGLPKARPAARASWRAGEGRQPVIKMDGPIPGRNSYHPIDWIYSLERASRRQRDHRLC